MSVARNEQRTAGGQRPQRRCPICDRVTTDRFCSTDRSATLVLNPKPTAKAKVGDILGDRYELLETIGSGGYGTVFRARHLGTGQMVALKTLFFDEDDSATMVEQFFHEARGTSSLAHPNTVRVFDFGQDDTGVAFFAMELLVGCTLYDELARRKAEGRAFSEEESIAIGVSITRSLTEAHAKGIIHRDLKPDNIFLQQTVGEAPVVRVLDFGVARFRDSRHTLSSSHQIHGTPTYMSPEHALASAMDGRSDLYSLGVILYELRTQAPPFSGDSDVQILYQHVHAPVPNAIAEAHGRASESESESASAPISDAFAQVLNRALAKEPEDRFPDAQAMRHALERCSTRARAQSLNDYALRERQETRPDAASNTRGFAFTAAISGAMGTVIVIAASIAIAVGVIRVTTRNDEPVTAPLTSIRDKLKPGSGAPPSSDPSPIHSSQHEWPAQRPNEPSASPRESTARSPNPAAWGTPAPNPSPHPSTNPSTNRPDRETSPEKTRHSRHSPRSRPLQPKASRPRAWRRSRSPASSARSADQSSAEMLLNAPLENLVRKTEAEPEPSSRIVRSKMEKNP
ncbi:MAG: protein kinase [Deltaproteobacteria bacterium]|nr:protein kinase [Deltaproteobacteria bacterium]